jgi:hypothetical protein
VTANVAARLVLKAMCSDRSQAVLFLVAVASDALL